MNNEQKKKQRMKLTDTVPYILIIGVILMVIGQLLGDVIYVLLPENASDAARIAFEYLAFIGIWAVFLAVNAIFKRNRFILPRLWRGAKGNTLRMLAVGLGAGAAMNLFCALVAWLNGDIHLYFASFEPLSFVLIFLCVFVQSSAEELVCRGYMYEKLLRRHRPITAVFFNAAVFAFLHILNPNVQVMAIVNILLVGILYSLVCYYTESIWCAMMMHAAWNFTQNILLGLPNSGIVSPYSVFRLEASTARDSWAYNVGFGVECTWTSVLLHIALITALVLVFRKKRPSLFTKPVIEQSEEPVKIETIEESV